MEPLAAFAIISMPIFLAILGFFLNRLVKQVDGLVNQVVKLQLQLVVMDTKVEQLETEIKSFKKSA